MPRVVDNGTPAWQSGSAPVAFIGPYLILTSDTAPQARTQIWTRLIVPSTGLPQSGTNYADVIHLSNQENNLSLDLDDSNTMYVYSVENNGYIQREPLMRAAGALALGAAQPIILNGEIINSAGPPQIGYVASSPRPGQLRTAQSQQLRTVASDVYRFVFVTDSAQNPSQVKVAIQYYGARHVVETINDLYTSGTARQQALVAKGIIDGPMPVPQQNVRLTSQGGTISDWELYKPIGRVSYGTNRSEETTHKVTIDGSIGVDATFEAAAGIVFETSAELGFLRIFSVQGSAGSLTEMFGVKTEMTTKLSFDSTLGWGTATVREDNVIGLTRIVPATGSAPGENATPMVGTQGFVSGSSLSALCRAIAFEDPQRPGQLPARPSLISVMPVTRVQLVSHYTADYEYTPGDLNSYSIPNINRKMNAAYTNWKSQNPNARDPFGSDYLMEDDYNGYFEKVVQKSALPIGPGGRRYLEFSVSNDGLCDTRFDLTKLNFWEWGTRIDASFYRAVTWENEINVAGFDVQSYLEAGVSFDVGAGYTAESERSDQWGISAEIENFPEAVRPGDVCAYSFRLYLLPADNRWAQEVLCFSDYNRLAENALKPIDPNSRPWKIMFVVDPSSVTTLS
jgi:hypothetical protein